MLARANAHIGLLQCQADLELGNRDVMWEEDLLAEALQSQNSLDSAFKVLVAARRAFRLKNRYLSSPFTQAHGCQAGC